MRLLFLLSTALFPLQALACSCLPGSYEEYLDWSETAFIGTLSEVPVGAFEQDDDLTFTFTVDTLIDGEANQTIEIQSRFSSALCGWGETFLAEPGSEWVIFAEKNRGNTFRVSQCGGSHKYDPSDTTLQAWLLSRSGFIDVPDDHPQYEAINYVLSQKIVQGYSDQTYRPDQTINRAEFTKIMVESSFSPSEINACDTVSLGLNDVPSEAWFAPYVCVALDHGILSGYPDGSFGPGNLINLAETSKILAKTFFPDTAKNFPLQGSVTWYEDFMDLLVNQDVFASSDTERPNHPITRGEMAEFVWRVLR